MVLPDFTELDQDEISRNSFFPRENVAPIPEGAELHNIDVGNNVSLSCRFFPVGKCPELTPNPGKHLEEKNYQ